MRIAPTIKRQAPLWFAGICDELYSKIAIWDNAYWYGEIHSTRQFLTKSGELVDRPTKMAHEIPFREVELDQLIVIMEALRPATPMIEELKRLKKVWKYGKPVRGYVFRKSYWSKITLPQGMHRVITVAFYPEHVKDILTILQEAKTGQKAATFESIIKDKSDGKDLFEE